MVECMLARCYGNWLGFCKIAHAYRTTCIVKLALILTHCTLSRNRILTRFCHFNLCIAVLNIIRWPFTLPHNRLRSLLRISVFHQIFINIFKKLKRNLMFWHSASNWRRRPIIFIVHIFDDHLLNLIYATNIASTTLLTWSCNIMPDSVDRSATSDATWCNAKVDIVTSNWINDNFHDSCTSLLTIYKFS